MSDIIEFFGADDVPESFTSKARSTAGAYVASIVECAASAQGKRKLTSLSYDADEESVRDDIQKLIADVRDQWFPTVKNVAIAHRLNACAVGDVVMVVAASATGFDEASKTVHTLVKRIRRRVAIRLTCKFEDGSESTQTLDDFAADSDEELEADDSVTGKLVALSMKQKGNDDNRRWSAARKELSSIPSGWREDEIDEEESEGESDDSIEYCVGNTPLKSGDAPPPATPAPPPS
jgi:molybdopterin synthase catalytic subunit